MLAKFPKMKKLFLSQTSVTNLDAISELTALTDLSFSRTLVKNIAPLSKLSALRRLDASFNDISDFSALSNCKSLNYIFLNDTKIDNVDFLKGLQFVQEVTLANTPVAEKLAKEEDEKEGKKDNEDDKK
jgi:Leucine-rich repeat (LRR) protein